MSTYIKLNGYKFINVKYFDGTEILNDDIRYLLNSKIIEMRNKFEMNLVSKVKDLK